MTYRPRIRVGPVAVRAGAVVTALAWSPERLWAQPDASMSDIAAPARGAVSSPVGSATYSIGGSTCNLGGTPLAVAAAPGPHPVFAQNLYRLKDGRIQQVGMSWCFHEFCALQLQCTFCNPAADCSFLGPGCATSDSSTFAGNRGSLGPRSQVNPATGALVQPATLPSAAFPSGRILVANDDLDPALNPGAMYFSELVVVAPGEVDRTNNASHRRASVGAFSGGGWNIANGPGATVGQPAIAAWAANSLSPVTLSAVDVPGDGRLYVASSARFLGNRTWRYEYAVYNLGSDRAVGSFTALTPALLVTVTNTGFAAPAWHSGEVYSNAPWTVTHLPGDATDRWVWATAPYSQDANANALRWGVLDNFWFDADSPPRDGAVVLGLFKPGTPESVSAPAVMPSFPCRVDVDRDGVVTPADVAGFVNTWYGSVQNGTLAGDFDGNGIVQPADIAAFISAWSAALSSGC